MALAVPSREARAPEPATPCFTPRGSAVSGQNLVHPLASVQVTLPPVSELRVYRVRPCPFTRTRPRPGTAATFTVYMALEGWAA
jgi:hypothetical protein